MKTQSVLESPLALLGGPKTITIEQPEQWNPPIEREIELCTRVIKERSFSSAGTGIAAEFESQLRDFINAKYCLVQNNGTSTLLAAYFAVGVGPGDEIIVPSYTWIASFSPAMLLGARPVFCEFDPNTYMADPADIEKRITPRTKAICVVHLFGNVCDMDRILAIGKKHGIPIIEDCSHSTGAKWDGKMIGSLGDIGCFSMQGATSAGGKPLAGGEAGFVVTNNRRYYERMLVMGHVNRKGVPEEFTDPDYKSIGVSGFCLAKFRPNALSIAIGMASLESLSYRSKKIWDNYLEMEAGLKGVPGIRLASRYPKAQPGGFCGNFRGIYNPDELGGLPIEKFMQAANAEGAFLGGRAYIGWHLNPIFTKGLPLYDDGRGPLSGDYRPYKPGDLPVTEKTIGRTTGFPALIEPKKGYIAQFVGAIRKVSENYRDLL